MIAVFAICWVLFAFLCAYIAQTKGLDVGLWALLGLIFGIFALIIVAIEPARSADADDDEPRPLTPLDYLSNPSLWDIRTRKGRKANYEGRGQS